MKKITILLLAMILVGCGKFVEKRSKRLVFKENMIQITIDSVKKLDLGEDSEITFKLWGYDLYLADVKATLLKEYKYNLSKLPVTYGIDYQKKWDEKIKPNGSGKYGYYITLVGNSMDGKKYKVDHESSDNGYFGVKKTKVQELSGKIYIKEIK